MAFAVKAKIADPRAKGFAFAAQKTMYGGKHVAAGDNGIDHRLTKVKHPWTNGQVERMNRTIKDRQSQ